MKVCIISTMGGGPWGGSETLWFNISKRLLEQKIKVVASVFGWSQTHPKLEEFKYLGGVLIKRKRISKPGVKGKAEAFLNKKLFGLKDLQKSSALNPDMYFFSLGAAFDLSTDPYSTFIRKLKAPYIIYLSLNTEYEVLPFELMAIQREIFEKAKVVIFPSQRNLDAAKRQLASNLTNAVVINNPITFSDLSEVPCKAFDTINFASVARLDAYVKGQGVLLEVLSKDKWKDRNWKLNIYGKGPDEAYLKELTKFYKLEHKVSFKGHVKDIKQEIWGENHVLLMPSQYEGCPISLYDAAICGKPAVVSDVGGNAEFVVDGLNGFVADASSVKSFGNAIEKLWQSKNQIKEFGMNAREKALSVLDLSPSKTIINKYILGD